MFYLYEIRESDGNDCSVFDCIVEAESRDAANDQLHAHFEELAKDRDWESDGDFGYYFPCDCKNPEPEPPAIPCDSCECLTINGVACHETGCPEDRQYRRDLKRYENFECQGHGGLPVGDPREFETEDDAENECSRWHSRYTI